MAIPSDYDWISDRLLLGLATQGLLIEIERATEFHRPSDYAVRV